MAKKQIIRLTESDLHKIIEESVEQIISELDWRTYDKAAEKAFEKYEQAPSHEEGRVKMYQSNQFKDAALKRQAQQYDGITDRNYEGNLSDYPKEINGKPTSKRKQMAGAAQIARYKRGGDVFNPETKKWQPK